MKRSAKPPLVHVVWTDSMSARGWRTREEVQELIEAGADIDSVGWLIHRDSKKVVLVSSMDRQEKPNTNHYHEIPTCMVKSVRRLKQFVAK